MNNWQFAIDVGGTFTDCVAQAPDGQILRYKLLSTGATKGAVGPGSHPTAIVDPARLSDPDGFFNGCSFLLLDTNGNVVAQSRIDRFERQTATLHLTPPLSSPPTPGGPYELLPCEEAPIVAIRYLLGLRPDEPIPPVAVRLGTTRGTNALLTRRGARTALVTTRGFRDVLEIGYQNRPRLFELAIQKPQPLASAVLELDERVAPDGQVLVPLDPGVVRRQLDTLKDQQIESLAVCLLHAHACGQHEELVARIARELGFQEISLSSRVAPLVKIVARGDTTVMDAYLNPVLRTYVDRLRQSLGSSRLQILTSAGGLVDAGQFVGKDSILSGPAGGVVGIAHVAGTAGFARAIGLDMGGTSSDVSRYDGRYELQYETEKAGFRVVAPMLAVETVAAGGGSLCKFDGVKLVVGPDSAGASPGPACYGRGGPLAITDMNLFQGKILPERFPFPLQRQPVQQKLQVLCRQIRDSTGTRYTPHELADGFTRVANANMVRAIRSISIAKGYDPRHYVLVAFGGAAGQHACAVARELSIQQVLSHPDAGVLSAYGIRLADVTRHREASVYRPYSESALAQLDKTFARLADEAQAEILAEGIPPERIEVRRSLDLRYRGLDASLNIPEPDSGSYTDAYAAEHQRLYGYRHDARPVEIVAARVQVIGRSQCESISSRPTISRTVSPERVTEAWFDGRQHATAVYGRENLSPGDVLAGPAIVGQSGATTVVDPGWEAKVLPQGELLLTDRQGQGQTAISTEADPIMLEIFNNQFAGIAHEMGITLRNTASSVNVKERLDFSCAIFTPSGDLVVNAPHIPVHLGAMGQSVRSILADNPVIRPGDVFATNDPYRGGAHLPDVTVVTPVHEPATGELLFVTASRAHHAEIGGIVPGSMPPFSRNLAEEGVLISNFRLVDAGQSRLDALKKLLQEAPYPSRAVDDNLADTTAQIAANNQGARDLARMVQRYTLPVVRAYMDHIQAAAERKLRAALARLPDGVHGFVDSMDDGSPIAVAIQIRDDEATIDFTGTGPVVPGNLNANRAIVTAAVMYVLRSLMDEDIPLNQGVLAPVRLILPECLLNPPRRETPDQCAAVVGGNVETSQRVVDCLLGALGVAAASQGTMNNVLFGNATFGYYETICGGAGATGTCDGADAVHTHMTNTRLTDPEVLELRYPVRVQEFSIRRGSGGAGRYRGGDGVVRRLQFLAPLDLSILSQRRGPYPPFGLENGQPGALGRNALLRADGTCEPLPALAQCKVLPGDILVIETPGGGGFGQTFNPLQNG